MPESEVPCMQTTEVIRTSPVDMRSEQPLNDRKPTGAVSTYEPLATGRYRSVFAADMEAHRPLLRNVLEGSRVAVIGAAGSIGASVVRCLLPFRLSALVLFDLNENGLVELVRDLHASPDVRLPDDFAELPIGLGSNEFLRYFQDNKPFDFLFNLSALKHVRSEKDIYSLMRMINTNVLYLDEFLSHLPKPCVNVFSVSSDKAVNPASLMGATKNIMEKVLLRHSYRQPFSTARFANVAFSNGSLPYGFLMRIAKRQPIAAPEDVQRFFISHDEAGELCLLACCLGENGDLFFPKPDTLTECRFSEIARRTLHAVGYEVYECSSEQEAKSRIDELLPRGLWPCYFSSTDTSGEKHFEEFYSDSDHVDLSRFRSIGVIQRCGDATDDTDVDGFLRFARTAADQPSITKQDYIEAFRKVLPALQHTETGKSLDHKM